MVLFSDPSMLIDEGVSWVTTDRTSIDDISIINSWPGHPITIWKTPTRIAYKKENPSLHSDKWGFEVDSRTVSCSWTKLLLDQHAEKNDYDDPSLSGLIGSGMMRLPSHRTAQGVCEDFLREIWKHVSGILKKEMSVETFAMTPIECWVTLPAIWSDEAKAATLKAASNAGFGSRIFDKIYTIAEPEAAAVATLKKYSGANTLNSIKVCVAEFN